MSIDYLLKVAKTFEKKLAQRQQQRRERTWPRQYQEGDACQVFDQIGKIHDGICRPFSPQQCSDGYSLVVGTKARGRVRLQSSKPTQITTGARLTSPHGRLFRVLRGGTYANNAAIEVEAWETGSIDNERQGSVFTWMNTPAESASTAVAVSNFTGGTNNKCE